MPEIDESTYVSLELLSKREREILFFLAQGYSNDQIALIFNISSRTVSTHRNNMMGKLKVNCLAKLIRLAYQQNLIRL